MAAGRQFNINLCLVAGFLVGLVGAGVLPSGIPRCIGEVFVPIVYDALPCHGNFVIVVVRLGAGATLHAISVVVRGLICELVVLLQNLPIGVLKAVLKVEQNTQRLSNTNRTNSEQ